MMRFHEKAARLPLLCCAVAAATMVVTTTNAQAETDTTTSAEIKALRHELDLQRRVTRKLEKKIDHLATNARRDRLVNVKSALPSTVRSHLNAGYDNGFFIRDAPGNFSLNVNGLLQARFTHFATENTAAFGAVDRTSNNFDVYLGRLYFSGNVVDPSIRYWFTLQGTTVANGSGITLLDGEISKTFNPFLTVEAGRFWSAYTYEYYVSIGKYLFPDLSAAEWAFSLGRQIGVRASGKADRLGYSLSVTNSVPGSDVGFTENTRSQLATVLHLDYDILAPYGYQETDPNPAGVRSPELSLWASGMYNDVAYASAFQNDQAGDKTFGGTTSLNFRYGFLSFQASAYFKATEANRAALTPHGAFDSYGWQEQLGYYLLPGKLEIAERVDQVNCGAPQIPFAGGSESQWYSGPTNFPYKQLTEMTGGINYYFSGHYAKVQGEYSYMPGIGFNGKAFNGQRLLVQTQVQF